MLQPIVFAALALAVLALAAAAAIQLSKARLATRNKDLTAKLLQLEARIHDLMRGRAASGAPAATTRQERVGSGAGANVRKEDSRGAEALQKLRREVAHQKDEIKKLREDSRQKDRALSEEREAEEGRLFHLREENKRLVELLQQASAARKEATASAQALAGIVLPTQEKFASASAVESADRPNGTLREGPLPGDAAAARSEELDANAALRRLEREKAQAVTELKQELGRSRARTQELELRLKDFEQGRDAAAEKTRALESALRRFQEAAKAADGKPLDPILFLRWKERALEGRRMYRLMRQLRELSDDKLATYQEAVVALAQDVFAHHGEPAPAVREGEVKADRYLAAAWAVSLANRSRAPDGRSNAAALAPPFA